MAGRPLDTSYEASQTATRVLAKEHSTNYGSKVFMDARMPVTHKEGDRYPLGPPSFCGVKCKNKFHAKKKRKNLKIQAIEYKGGKCEKCGYDRCVEALEFHHVDPNEKEFSISKTGNTYSWEKIKNEIDKCSLLCANCHREVHVEQLNVD